MFRISQREGLSIMWLALGSVYLGLYLPFWKAILLGLIFALALTPMLDRVRMRLQVPRVKPAYGIVGTFVTFIFIILTFLMVHVYSTVVRALKEPGTAASISERWGAIREKITQWLTSTKILPSAQIRSQIETTLNTITVEAKESLAALGQAMVAEAPNALLQTLIFFLAFGIFLGGGNRIWHVISAKFQLSPVVHEKYKRFELICARSLGSIFLVGSVQAALTVIGAAISGYGALFAIFVITFVFSMIPVLGAGVVPVLLSMLAFFDGNSTQAIILLVTALIVGASDNILRAWLFSRAANIHPLISLISLLGALQIFGFVGVFIAPVLEQLVMAHFIYGPETETSRAPSGNRPQPTSQYSPAT